MQLWKSSCNFLQFIQISLCNLCHDKTPAAGVVYCCRPRGLVDTLSVVSEEWAGMAAANSVQNIPWAFTSGQGCACWRCLGKQSAGSHLLTSLLVSYQPSPVVLKFAPGVIPNEVLHSQPSYHLPQVLDGEKGNSPLHHLPGFHSPVYFPFNTGKLAPPYRLLSDLLPWFWEVFCFFLIKWEWWCF